MKRGGVPPSRYARRRIKSCAVSARLASVDHLGSFLVQKDAGYETKRRSLQKTAITPRKGAFKGFSFNSLQTAFSYLHPRYCHGLRQECGLYEPYVSHLVPHLLDLAMKSCLHVRSYFASAFRRSGALYTVFNTMERARSTVRTNNVGYVETGKLLTLRSWNGASDPYCSCTDDFSFSYHGFV